MREEVARAVEIGLGFHDRGARLRARGLRLQVEGLGAVGVLALDGEQWLTLRDRVAEVGHHLGHAAGERKHDVRYAAGVDFEAAGGDHFVGGQLDSRDRLDPDHPQLRRIGGDGDRPRGRGFGSIRGNFCRGFLTAAAGDKAD